VSTENDNQATATALITTAINAGAHHAVLSPGARNTPLVLALHRCQQAGWPITLHSVIDERAAGFFALGLARRTGEPTLLCCTSGSALTHYFPAITEASQGEVPLVVLSADRPEELQNCGAPQTISQGGIFGVHSRFSSTLEAPNCPPILGPLHALMRGAIEAATGAGHHGTPGPAHLNIRFRKPLWSTETCALESPTPTPIFRERSTPKPEDITRLLKAALDTCGVIVVGPDPASTLKPGVVQQLADGLGWPVLTDPITTMRFGKPGPFVHHHDALLRSTRFRSATPIQMVIALGGTPSSAPLQKLIAQTPTIALHQSSHNKDPFQSVCWTFHADPALAVKAISAADHEKTHPHWLAHWMQADALAKAAIIGRCGSGLWEGSVAHQLVAGLPKDCLLRVASSMPIRDLDSFAVSGAHPVTVSSNRGVNGIDGLLATTLGEAAAHDGPVALLSGDLSFLHDVGALATVPRPAQSVVVTILDNGGGGIFGRLPIKNHETAFEPWFLCSHGHDIANIIRGFGLDCHCPSDLDAYRLALSQGFGQPGLSFILVRIDRPWADQQRTLAHAAITAQIEAKL
jgi:2-succinyl-5-enolpyruvyl-6-hydroxy-3-cyclohexene-1-carboxylate synthase